MPDFIFPSPAEMTEIAQEKLPNLTEDRLIFELLPMVDADEDIIIWEQQDMYGGLQAVRGLDGAPSRVKSVGAKRYMSEPGVYGEFMSIDEAELTRRRARGDGTGRIDIEDLVMMKQDQLLSRRLDRIEYIGWQLLLYATFAIARNNIIMHTDKYTGQTYTASIAWSNAATATPLADFRAIQLLSRGKGTDFGAAARAIMNRTTANRLLANTNAADIGGRKGEFGASLTSMEGVNRVQSAEGLPNLEIYDDGYFANDDGTGFTLWIPDNKVLVVGARPAGQRIGEYRMTANANNTDFAAGPYQKVIDRGENSVPRTIEVHDGHNGGPVIYYPGSVLVMSV
jgi:hypothetical protein